MEVEGKHLYIVYLFKLKHATYCARQDYGQGHQLWKFLCKMIEDGLFGKYEDTLGLAVL